MTTKISQIYDAIVDVIEAELTTSVRIPNPYILDINSFLHLKKGFGVAIGPGDDTQRYIGCLVTWERNFTIAIIQQMVATQNNVGTREVIEKELLDDHDKLRKAFYNNSTLSGKAIKSTITDDGGVSFIDGDRLKFIALEMNLLVEYQEDPNT